MVDGGRQCFGGFFPDPIWVDPCALGPRVAVDDSIGVDHRDDLEGIAIVEEGIFSLGFREDLE